MIVQYDRREHVAYVTLRRPEKLNAVNKELLEGLREAWEAFRQDRDAWVAILSGEGRAFCAGVDVGSLESATQDWQRMSTYLDALPWGNIETDRSMTKPVIAAIHGYCLGAGMTLALASDFRVCAEGTQLGFPEVRRGIPTVIGACLAPGIVGQAAAMRLLLPGDHIAAEEALRMGVITDLVPKEEVLSRAEQWAELLCQAAPLAVRSTKEIILRAQEAPFEHNWRLGEALRRLSFGTEDAVEGVQAWREKRKPKWRGK